MILQKSAVDVYSRTWDHLWVAVPTDSDITFNIFFHEVTKAATTIVRESLTLIRAGGKLGGVFRETI